MTIKELLNTIVNSHEMHAKWLNTLSYLENCGARKIAACEHPTLVKEEMLKHAAEEFRHALHLKQQIKKIAICPIDYSPSNILGDRATISYLNTLDIKTSRYLKTAGFSKDALKQAAYLLVTYAIELRADELYPIYDEVLKSHQSKVTVKSILLEEKEHLKEMQEGLQKIALGMTHAKNICAIESELYEAWLKKIIHGELIINHA